MATSEARMGLGGNRTGQECQSPQVEGDRERAEVEARTRLSSWCH